MKSSLLTEGSLVGKSRKISQKFVENLRVFLEGRPPEKKVSIKPHSRVRLFETAAGSRASRREVVRWTLSRRTTLAAVLSPLETIF